MLPFLFAVSLGLSVLLVFIEAKASDDKAKRYKLMTSVLLSIAACAIAWAQDNQAGNDSEKLDKSIHELRGSLTRSEKSVDYLQRELQKHTDAKEAVYTRWATSAGLHDQGERKLGNGGFFEPSGRYISAWYDLEVKRIEGGGTRVVITYQGKSRSTNDGFGAKGTFVLKVDEHVRGVVKSDCNRHSSHQSKIEKYTLTDQEVLSLDPKSISLSRDYK